MMILQNLITTNHRKSGNSKDDLKLTELDVVTMRIRYRVNSIGGVQPFPRDSKDKENFAMLDKIRIASKENRL